ncbi:flavoprotein [Paenibacillus sp. PK3_47]|uniref:flavodoxin family protein n=1 Tax=Paenibacillus sp. PK3_47 TaxID=2072642 RepID=UPI00201DB10D|nr:flavodoxin family protein [Paenibacillus sp. PK3_47]UQZ32993.1 flavoprotein [Paenibacillus sp. PK3_47]
MRLIVHDLAEQEYNTWLKGFSRDTDEVIGEEETIRHCVGCFGCWVRTPGTCVLKDSYTHMGERLAACEEFVLITRNVYGGYSPFVCNVMNRTLPYILPYFITRNGETHHQQRYERQFRFTVHFYGEGMTGAECGTAQALVKANALNLDASDYSVSFHDSVHSLKEVQ